MKSRLQLKYFAGVFVVMLLTLTMQPAPSASTVEAPVTALVSLLTAGPQCKTIAGPASATTTCDGKAMTIFTNRFSIPGATLRLSVCVTVENAGDCPLTLTVGTDAAIIIPAGLSTAACGTLGLGETISIKSTAVTGKTCKYNWRVDNPSS